MGEQQVLVRAGEGESLTVMGAGIRFLCPAAATQQKWSLMEVSLPEGTGPPPHVHPWDEAYYVVEGEIAFFIAGHERRVRAGDFLYAPAGTAHGFTGASSEPARLLVFDAPAHTESFFREVDEQVRTPADMAKVPAIGAKHQVDFLRPAPAAHPG